MKRKQFESKLRATVCGECGKVFQGKRQQYVCEPGCRARQQALRKEQLESKLAEQRAIREGRYASEEEDPRSLLRTPPVVQVRIYYVYFWFKDGEIFPFYVGHGAEDRYKAVHSDNSHTGTARCEKIRRSCKKFKAAIIVDNLTVREARLIENVFIHYFSSIGVLLTNQQGHGNSTGREATEGEVGEGRESGV